MRHRQQDDGRAVAVVNLQIQQQPYSIQTVCRQQRLIDQTTIAATDFWNVTLTDAQQFEKFYSKIIGLQTISSSLFPAFVSSAVNTDRKQGIDYSKKQSDSQF